MKAYKAKKHAREVQRNTKINERIVTENIAVHQGKKHATIVYSMDDMTVDTITIPCSPIENVKLFRNIMAFISNKKATYINGLHIYKQAQNTKKNKK